LIDIVYKPDDTEEVYLAIITPRETWGGGGGGLHFAPLQQLKDTAGKIKGWFQQTVSKSSAWDPFEFDADPVPGSALKNGSGSGFRS